MYCENCGKKQNSNENYCTECGNKYQQPINSRQSLSKSNISLILGIISDVFIIIPFVAIPLAITSILIVLKNKLPKSNLIPAIISLIFALLEIIFIIMLIIFSTNYKTSSILDLIKQEFYQEIEPLIESYDISGQKWVGDDDSLLDLSLDQNFVWYQNQQLQNNNLYQGNYQIYTDYKAISYIAENLSEYGLTRYEQIKNITESNHSINEYYLIILECQKIVIDGIEQTPNNNIIYYYGYYEEEINYLNLTNMATQNKAGFTNMTNSNNPNSGNKYQF